MMIQIHLRIFIGTDVLARVGDIPGNTAIRLYRDALREDMEPPSFRQSEAREKEAILDKFHAERKELLLMIYNRKITEGIAPVKEKIAELLKLDMVARG